MAVEEMPDTMRVTLEKFGVVKTPKPPTVDRFIKAIIARKGKLTLSCSPDGVSANVRLSGKGYDDISDNPSIAIGGAFTQALLAEPGQISFFGGDPTLGDETQERLRKVKERRENESETPPSEPYVEGATDDVDF